MIRQFLWLVRQSCVQSRVLLRLFAGKCSKNSGISLIGLDSYKNRIRVEIGAKNKQTKVKRREKGHSRAYTCLHARLTHLGGCTTCVYPRAPFCTVAGQDGSVWTGRSGLVAVLFAYGAPDRTRVDPNPHPNTCLLACGTRLSSRSSPRVDHDSVSLLRTPADASLSCVCFIFQMLAFSIYFLQIFLSFNP